MYAIGDLSVERRLFLSLQLGIMCSAVGASAASFAFEVVPFMEEFGRSLFIAVAAFSGFAVGAYVWHTFVAPKATPSRIRVVCVMTFAAILAPILSLLIAISVWDFIEIVKNPFMAISGAVVVGMVSTLLVGWLTVPAAIAIGLFFRTKHLRNNRSRVDL
jgi:hypothetical protein